MKRDDMGMRIDKIRELATKYSKPDLQRMVQMGMVNPQEAVMAGMMIDRISKSAMKPPETTVAEDVLGAAPTAAQGQIPPDQMPPGQMPPQMPPQMAAGGGLMGMMPHSDGVAALPSNIHHMAGGGIVAFAEGGSPEEYVRASRGVDAALAGMQPQSDMPVLPGGYRLRETALPDRSNIASEIGVVGEAERLAGYDPDMYKRQREEELGRKEELAKRREEAKGEAILSAGLGLMGARKGREFETFSRVSQQALAQYKGDISDIRKSENEMRKAARELEMAENAAKKSKSEKGLERYQKKQDAYDAAAARRDETYNAGMFKLVDYFSHQEGIDKQTATQMAVAALNSKTQFGVAKMQQDEATKRQGMPDSQERIINNALADLRRTNPDATYSDALQVVKGSGKTNQLQLIENYADDYNKLDIMQRKDMEKRGITNEEDYIKYRIGLAGKVTGASGAAQPTATTSPPSAAVSYLRANPNLAAEFNSKYGAGAAERILGTR